MVGAGMVTVPEYALFMVQDEVVYVLDDVIGVGRDVTAEVFTGHVRHDVTLLRLSLAYSLDIVERNAPNVL